jgi:hypothetical protein
MSCTYYDEFNLKGAPGDCPETTKPTAAMMLPLPQWHDASS